MAKPPAVRLKGGKAGDPASPIRVWDVVRVPFPYTDRPVRQRRPALVIAMHGKADAPELLWVLMITSAENRGWPGDVGVADLAAAGLPAPPVVRTEKVAAIDARDAEPIGRLSRGVQSAVVERLRHYLDDVGLR